MPLRRLKTRNSSGNQAETYYGLGSGAIEECLAEMFERRYAIGAFLRLRASGAEASRAIQVPVSYSGLRVLR
jgi:hypothetical protein